MTKWRLWRSLYRNMFVEKASEGMSQPDLHERTCQALVAKRGLWRITCMDCGNAIDNHPMVVSAYDQDQDRDSRTATAL